MTIYLENCVFSFLTVIFDIGFDFFFSNFNELFVFGMKDLIPKCV